MIRKKKSLTPRQIEALAVIRHSIDTTGVAPSHLELGKALGVHPSTATGLLRRMEQRGAIYCKPFTMRGIEVLI